MIGREPTTFVAVGEPEAGTVAPPKRSCCTSRCGDRDQLDAPVADALELAARARPRRTDARPGARRAWPPWRASIIPRRAPRRRRRQHADPPRRVPRRRAGRRLALRDRARVDRGRARRRAAQPARAARPRLRRPRRVDRLLDRAAAAAGVDRDGRALPRPRDAGGRPGRADRACRSGSTTRARSAPTGSSTPSPPSSARRAVRVVDFGTAITFDVVRAGGEYVGGIIAPGVEISMEALTSRAAAIPRIDLTPPRALIGKSTVEAIRSGVDLRLRRAGRRDRRPPARGAGRGDRGDRDRRPGGRDRAVLRPDRRRRRHADAHGPAAHPRAQRRRLDSRAMRSLHDPWELGGIAIPNRVVLAPLAGIGNWFVRLQAKRYGAGPGGPRDGLELRDPLRQPEDARRAARRSTRTSARAGRSRSSSSARTRRSCARPRAVAAERGRGPHRPQHGLPGAEGDARPARAPRCSATRTPRSRSRGRPREGSGLPVTVKLRAALEPGGVGASRPRAGSSRRPASPA